MNLYQIDAEILKLIDFETGEVLDEAQFEELAVAKEVKIENTLLFIKNLTAEAAAIKEEEKALAERRKAKESKAENLKEYVSRFLDGSKFETSRVAASFRKSESLEISEGAKIPEEYMRYKEPEVNKADLKKAVKAGLELEGVQIIEKLNMQIK